MKIYFFAKNKQTNKFYNFITNSWVNYLTECCLNTFGKVSLICKKFKNTSINSLLYEINLNKIVDNVI